MYMIPIYLRTIPTSLPLPPHQRSIHIFSSQLQYFHIRFPLLISFIHQLHPQQRPCLVICHFIDSVALCQICFRACKNNAYIKILIISIIVGQKALQTISILSAPQFILVNSRPPHLLLLQTNYM